MIACEIERDGLWVQIGVEEAYELPPGTKKRCTECQQPVHLYPATKGSEASVPHFGHNKANPNCPHSAQS